MPVSVRNHWDDLPTDMGFLFDFRARYAAIGFWPYNEVAF